MSPLASDFGENLPAHTADDSEQNGTNLSKIGSAFRRYKSLKIGCFCDHSCMKFFQNLDICLQSLINSSFL